MQGGSLIKNLWCGQAINLNSVILTCKLAFPKCAVSQRLQAIHKFPTLTPCFLSWFRASLVAQRLKCLPAMRDTRVWSLDQEDHLEKERATHSSTLAWRTPWTEEPGRLQSMGSQRVRTQLSDFTFTFFLTLVIGDQWTTDWWSSPLSF